MVFSHGIKIISLVPKIVLHKFWQSVPQVCKMPERNMCRELLKTQQQIITCFVESIEKNISVNSELAQSLLKQASAAASRSLQEQLEGLIAKQKENASKLQALEEIQNETITIAEEQQWPHRCVAHTPQLHKHLQWSLHLRHKVMVGLNPGCQLELWKIKHFFKGSNFENKGNFVKNKWFYEKNKTFYEKIKAFLDGYKYRFCTQIFLFQRKSKV